MRAAAAALGVKPPAISYRINRLEDTVGTPLLLRTTRSVELTEAGRRLLLRANPALNEIAEAITDARSSGETPRGTLRIALSHIAFRYALADHMAEFQRQYPDITLELSFDDQLVDLAQGGFHAGIRIGDLLNQDMIAIQLTEERRIVHVASPDYLSRNGRPTRPEDLFDHQCIHYRYGNSSKTLEWEFQGPDGKVNILVNGSIIVNDTTAQLDAAKLGLGIAWFGEKIVEQDIRIGNLEVILDDYAIKRPPFFLYFPKEYKELKILRALIEFLGPRISKKRHTPQST